MSYDITSSIVAYNNGLEIIKEAIQSFLNTELNVKLYVIDNSTSDHIKILCNDKRIEYIFNRANLGFGAGHNVAIRKCLGTSKYHLILNPDIYFEGGTLEKIYAYMEGHADVGVVMPKITYPDGSMQYLCKNLPTPFDLIFRRFIPNALKPAFQQRFDRYEFRDSNYDEIMDVPCLSGCFMFVRTSVFNEVGMFDKRYYMYLEDVDLFKRIGAKFRTVYYPEVSVNHHYDKGSYRSWKLLFYHIRSAIKYFNKWGWFPLH